MNRFLTLLLDFQKMPRASKTRTFMEISGQAHYENVASNILAFYFDPKEEHGLKDLLLTSFLEMAGHHGVDVSGPACVEREYPADDGKRIDLLLEGENYIIGIENKIYHWEANDFRNYARVIDAKGREKPVIIKAVLGLHAEADKPLPPGGFVRFSYSQFWTRVRSLLGNYIAAANPKWVTYLIDFKETMSRLAGESESNREFTDFFLKNNEVIEELVSRRQALLNRLDGYNYSLERNLKTDLQKHGCVEKVWVWKGIVFVVDFTIQGHKIALDLAHTPTEWNLTVFDRNQKSQEFVRSLAATKSMRACLAQIPTRDGRLHLAQWDIHVTLIELQESVQKWTDALIAATDEISVDIHGKPVC